MNRLELRDASHRLLGTIDQSGSRHEGRDASYRLKGYYDPKTNETRDASNRLVAKGNLLSALVTGPTR